MADKTNEIDPRKEIWPILLMSDVAQIHDIQRAASILTHSEAK